MTDDEDVTEMLQSDTQVSYILVDIIWHVDLHTGSYIDYAYS